MKKLPKKYFFNLRHFPLAIRKVEGFQVSHEHDYTGIPHYHNFSELVIITKGKGEQNINGKCGPVAEGDVFLFSGETVHYFPDHRELGLLNVMFDPSVYAADMESLHRIPGFQLLFSNRRPCQGALHLNRSQLAHAMAMLEEMETELTAMLPGYEAVSSAQFIRLIAYLARSLTSENRDGQAFQRISPLLARLETQFARPWTLDAMAKAVNMSKNNFIRVFQAAEHCTPMKYLNRLRLCAACRLLREKRQTITEIAFLCGFRDPNYFSKRFSAAFKITPKEYRQRS